MIYHTPSLKDIPDTLSIVCSPDGLGQRGRNVNDAKLLALVDLVTQRDGVGDDDLAQHAVVENVDSITWGAPISFELLGNIRRSFAGGAYHSECRA